MSKNIKVTCDICKNEFEYEFKRGVVRKYCSDKCKNAAKAERARKYRKENPEAVAESSARYKRKNKLKVRASHRKWSRANKDIISEKNKRAYQNKKIDDAVLYKFRKVFPTNKGEFLVDSRTGKVECVAGDVYTLKGKVYSKVHLPHGVEHIEETRRSARSKSTVDIFYDRSEKRFDGTVLKNSKDVMYITQRGIVRKVICSDYVVTIDEYAIEVWDLDETVLINDMSTDDAKDLRDVDALLAATYIFAAAV